MNIKLSDKLSFQINLPHYPTPWAMRADLIVHILGLALALFCGGVALGLSVMKGEIGLVAATAIYAAGFIAMLAFSMAYNFATPRFQPLMRRLDHAGIFLMIAASYTPFTTQALPPLWNISMTTTVWILAGLGIVGKLFLPGLGKKIWVIFYVALGWLALVMIWPLSQNAPLAALILLGLGGLIYSVGTAFYMSKSLKYRRAIWHGHVVAGAITHYVAVLVGVVLVNQP
jgi:hemolysin III